MTKSYSIGQARDNLAAIVHEAEASQPVQITRRGTPVAVLISKQEYDRLRAGRARFWSGYRAFSERVKLKELNIDPVEIWGSVRDRSPGRDVDL